MGQASRAKRLYTFQKRKRRIVNQLASRCNLCGLKLHAAVFKFVPRDGEKLSFNIERALQQGVGLKILWSEIKKCDMVCANCYMVRKWNDAWDTNAETTDQLG